MHHSPFIVIARKTAARKTLGNASFVFHRRKSQGFWAALWQNFYFWMDYSFQNSSPNAKSHGIQIHLKIALQNPTKKEVMNWEI